MVISGKVSALSDNWEGITFAILGPGELFGEMGMLEGAEHTATVTALELTELAVLDRQDFLSLSETCPAVALKLLTILVPAPASDKRSGSRPFVPHTSRAIGEETLCLSEGLWGADLQRRQDRPFLMPTGTGESGRHLTGEHQQTPRRVAQAEGLVLMEHGNLTIWRVTELESLAGKQAERKPSARVFS